MTALDFMALFCLVMMVVILIAIFIFLGGLPGRIAKRRGHPNAKAVMLGGVGDADFCLGWLALCFDVGYVGRVRRS